MLKIRRKSKQDDFHPKTQPDEALSPSERLLEQSDPQLNLFQISLKSNEQQYSHTFTSWQKQVARTQKVSSSIPISSEQGCFTKKMINLRAKTNVLNKKELYFKKWLHRRERQSQLKKSIRISQKKKSCVSINFNIQNQASKDYNSRIHSRTVVLPEKKKRNISLLGGRSSQIQCDLQYPKQRINEIDSCNVFYSQRKTRVKQDQLLLHKKVKMRLPKYQPKAEIQNNSSYAKCFSILNTLIFEEKTKVLFPLKNVCPASKLKGIFTRRRHSESK